MDGGKQEFQGAVGDVAGRDVVNHAAPITNSNVVNLQFGQKDAVVEFVTEHQKAMIAELVDQIADATESHRLKIYRVVLARAGAKRVKEIRREAYLDIEQYLTAWVKRVTGEPGSVPGSESVAVDTEFAHGREAQFSELAAQLRAARASVAALQRKVMIVLGLLVLALACNSALGYKIWSERDQSCLYAGQAYAIGSAIDHPDPKAADLECVAGKNGAAPRWRQIEVSHKK
ncbi:hypothetical protein [Pandoraea pnomenusa]|uniref:hypothetical protein n=1 Tax=Pandoraea pnomenusa TaxID=93220 RepID=UPI0033414FC7